MKRQITAIHKLRSLMALPDPQSEHDTWCADEFFDPWELFYGILYGTYSNDFDELAIEVLAEIRDKQFIRDDLAAHMFREMLCNMDLCDYGTSPRVCFATREFAEILPELVERWKKCAAIRWQE